MKNGVSIKPKWNSIYSKPSGIPHWRKMNYDLGYECSECGYEAETEHETCPNCNTKMVIAKETKA